MKGLDPNHKRPPKLSADEKRRLSAPKGTKIRQEALEQLFEDAAEILDRDRLFILELATGSSEYHRLFRKYVGRAPDSDFRYMTDGATGEPIVRVSDHRGISWSVDWSSRNPSEGLSIRLQLEMTEEWDQDLLSHNRITR